MERCELTFTLNEDDALLHKQRDEGVVGGGGEVFQAAAALRRTRTLAGVLLHLPLLLKALLLQQTTRTLEPYDAGT